MHLETAARRRKDEAKVFGNFSGSLMDARPTLLLRRLPCLLNLSETTLRVALGGGESGQGLVEYAGIALLVSIAAVALIMLIGPAVPVLFQGALNAL